MRPKDTSPVITIKDYNTKPMAKSSQLGAELNALNDLTTPVDHLMQTNSCLARECRQLVCTVISHNDCIHMTKTVAISTSALATLAVVCGAEWKRFNGALTPVSEMLGIGGVMYAIGGVVAYVATNVADYIRSRGFRMDLDRLLEQRYTSLKGTIDGFEASIVDTFGPNSVPTDGLRIHYKYLIYKLGERMNARMGVPKGSDSLSGRSVFYSITNVVMQLSFPLAFISLDTLTKWQLPMAITAIGLAVTVGDFVYMVRDRNKAHPTVEAINELITHFESDYKTIQSLQTMKRIEL